MQRLGLTAGPVPVRLDASAKQGLFELVAHAKEHGFSGRWACGTRGLDHARMLAWSDKARAREKLEYASPGIEPGEALHALLNWDKDAVVQLAKDWARVDLSHLKLATAARGCGGCSSPSPPCCGC